MRYAEEPSPWEEMGPQEAGRNAVEMMRQNADMLEPGRGR